MKTLSRACLIVVVVLTSLALAAIAVEPTYDPLAVPDLNKVRTLDMTVKDEGRNREIPIRVYLPTRKTPQPVVLFSHGLGGSREFDLSGQAMGGPRLCRRVSSASGQRFIGLEGQTER